MKKKIGYKNNLFTVTQKKEHIPGFMKQPPRSNPMPVLIVRKDGANFHASEGYIGSNFRDNIGDPKWKPLLYSTRYDDVRGKGLYGGIGADTVNEAIKYICKTLYEREQAINTMELYINDHCVEHIEGD